MSKPEPFEREDRYIVIKRKNLSEDQAAAIDQTLEMYDIAQVPKAVVVEGDWPEYEPVWRMIEARVSGLPFVPDVGAALDTRLRKIANFHRCNGPRHFDLDVTEAANRLAGLQRQVDAYRLVAVNEGWNHRLVDAYGHKEYTRQRIEAVDASATRTIASGYDAAGYLRDHSAPQDSTS